MILAIDLSSPRGGIALLDGDTIRAQREWRDDAARHTAFWPQMASLVEETKLEWSAVELFAVGRGPGSYSGLRAALTAAAMLAAPGGQPVYAVSSGALLAAEWFASGAARGDRVAVAGDARRGAVWFAFFARGAAAPRQEIEWTIAPVRDFPARIAADIPVLTSERDRLAALLGQHVPFDLVERYPSAATLARLARARAAAGEPGEPIEPLYLHPPV